MPPTTPIPRFLLPQAGMLWRNHIPPSQSNTLFIRTLSKQAAPKKSTTTSSNKPLVLEKPSKFNPPSHGARIRREAPRYPGPSLSAEEKAAQERKKYPNMMPSQGTFMYWFIHNRGIHLWITFTTLFSLATIVWVTNFKRSSPFADMLPSMSSFFLHPIVSARNLLDVIKMNSDYMTKETMERRKQKVEDVQKRAAYRKAHGLETEAFGGWTAKSDEQLLGPGIPTGEGGEGQVNEGGVEKEERKVREKKPLKKWLGIW